MRRTEWTQPVCAAKQRRVENCSPLWIIVYCDHVASPQLEKKEREKNLNYVQNATSRTQGPES